MNENETEKQTFSQDKTWGVQWPCGRAFKLQIKRSWVQSPLTALCCVLEQDSLTS